DVVTSVQSAIDELKKVKDGGDVDVIKQKTEALSTEMQKIGSAMQQQQQSQTPPPAEGGNAAPEGDKNEN
ncbi:MAG: molecular chaperone DnaK, partial [Patescibacteria group bacterium]